MAQESRVLFVRVAHDHAAVDLAAEFAHGTERIAAVDPGVRVDARAGANISRAFDHAVRTDPRAFADEDRSLVRVNNRGRVNAGAIADMHGFRGVDQYGAVVLALATGVFRRPIRHECVAQPAYELPRITHKRAVRICTRHFRKGRCKRLAIEHDARIESRRERCVAHDIRRLTSYFSNARGARPLNRTLHDPTAVDQYGGVVSGPVCRQAAALSGDVADPIACP